jgi:hypothetical protein
MTLAGYKSCPGCSSSGYDSPDYYCEGGTNCRKEGNDKEFNLKKKKNRMNYDNDFGFSLVDEDEIKQQETALVAEKEKVIQGKIVLLDSTQEKLDGLVKMIMPLLDNLAKNPEKTHILWPNRVDKIKEFKEKILTYVGK